MSTKNVVLTIVAVLVALLVAILAAQWMSRREVGGTTYYGMATGTDLSPTNNGTPSGTPSGGPAPTGTPPAHGTQTVTAQLNQAVSALNMTVTPLAVVEDSRCPQGVQCIQAGTVRVRVRLASALGTTEQVIAIGGSMSSEAETVTLVSVSPPKTTSGVDPSTYRFTFQLTRQ